MLIKPYKAKLSTNIIMRPSSLGGGRILRRTLSVRLSVCLSVRPVIITERHVAPPSELQ